ncbi:MAG: DHH family phosphoesterase [Rhabdochlamydiaceae bacterium]
MSVQSSVKRESLLEVFSQEFSRIPAELIDILIFTHRQADPDALCSAAGLGLLLTSSFPNLKLNYAIVAPQGASSLGERVCTRLGIEFQSRIEDEQKIHRSDVIVIVDTGDMRLLEPYLNQIITSSARKVLIDHHSASLGGKWSEMTKLYVDPRSTSTCEIIVHGFPDSSFSKEVADILLTGLMFDSQHLGIATASTLEAALVLVRNGAEIDAAKKNLRNKLDRSELLARVKSAQRLQYEVIGKYLVLKSEVSSFHASVARMLLEIGGDVGVAYGESDGEARISVRSSQVFYKETGIDFATEVRKISEELELIGGGHPTAASLSGEATPSQVVAKLIDGLKARLL